MISGSNVRRSLFAAESEELDLQVSESALSRCETDRRFPMLVSAYLRDLGTLENPRYIRHVILENEAHSA